MARRRRAPGRRPPIVLLTLAAGLLLVLASARSGDPRLYPALIGAPSTTIYLIDNGLHSDLALPRASLISDPWLGRAVASTTDKAWILIGWGDARFYRDSGVSLARAADAARALLMPANGSVVHLQGLSSQPDMAFIDAHARAIEVSDAGMERLLARIDQSLGAGAARAPVPAPGPAGVDEGFFRSTETFSLIHLCNHWTAQALNAAGLPVDLAIDTLPAGLRLELSVRSWISNASAPRPALRSGGPPDRAPSTG